MEQWFRSGAKNRWRPSGLRAMTVQRRAGDSLRSRWSSLQGRSGRRTRRAFAVLSPRDARRRLIRIRALDLIVALALQKDVKGAQAKCHESGGEPDPLSAW